MRAFTILSVVLILLFTSIAVTAQGAGGVCPGAVNRALADLGTNCAGMSRNTACYGFNNVIAQFSAPVPSGFFTKTNERADLLTINSLQTGPLDLANDQWGVSLMSVQANLPDALPGQGVVFVLVGGAKVENAVSPQNTVIPKTAVQINVTAATELRSAPNTPDWKASDVLDSVPAGVTLPADAIDPTKGWIRVVYNNKPGWISTGSASGDLSSLTVVGPNSRTPMQAFFFRTGIGGVTCDQVPSLLAVQGPHNASVDITADGVNIRISSTIVLQTLPPGPNPTTFQLTTVAGLAIINPDTPNAIYVPAGFTISIPLSPDLHSVVGNWTPIRPVTPEELALLSLITRLPGNVLDYLLTVPVITQASGVGGVVPQFTFSDPATVSAIQAACNAGLLSPGVCQLFGF